MNWTSNPEDDENLNAPSDAIKYAKQLVDQDMKEAIEIMKAVKGIHKLIMLARTESKLAEQLGVSQQAVSRWTVQGYVPTARITQVIALYPELTVVELINPRKLS